MSPTLRLLALVILIGLSGYVHGVWTDRWSNSGELESAMSQLDRVPVKIGAWQGQDEELDPRQAQRAGFTRYLLRRYENGQTGRSLVVLLACGRAGPLALHTPDVCYRGAGYGLSGEAARLAFPGAKGAPAAAFWAAKFSKREAAVPSHLRLYWSWYGRASWQAPDNPRLEFAGLPALYKLYVIQDLARPDEPLEEEACKEFLRELLPELEKCFRA
jgi:hypothetical protein